MSSDSGNRRIRLGTTLNYNLLDNLEIFALLEREHRAVDDYEMFNQDTGSSILSVVQESEIYENSFALQFDWRMSGKVRWLLGGRFADNELAGVKFNPRASVVYNLDESQSLKLLYATGFNSPNFIQQRLLLPGVIVGNPDLKAETVRTTDIAYSYFKSNFLFVANVFYLEARDFIERAAVGGVINYFNQGEFDRSGLELDFHYTRDRYDFFANLGYLREGNQDLDDDISALFMPRYTLSTGFKFDINERNEIGASMRFQSKRNNVSSVALLNLNYEFNYGKYHFFSTVQNLFDREVDHPDVTNFKPEASLVSEDGRRFLTGIRYAF